MKWVLVPPGRYSEHWSYRKDNVPDDLVLAGTDDRELAWIYFRTPKTRVDASVKTSFGTKEKLFDSVEEAKDWVMYMLVQDRLETV